MAIATECDPKNRVIQYWNAKLPEAWPKAASDKLSIFEALQAVGAAKFGDKWDGTEFDAVWWYESPEAEHNRLAARLRDVALHAERVRKAAVSFSNVQSVAPSASAPILSHDFETAEATRNKRQAHWEANRDALERLQAATEWLAQRCRDGDLQAYARPNKIGALYPMMQFEWNVENPLGQYVRNGGCERYFSELGQTFGSYVFFDRAELSRVTATLKHAPISISETDLAKFSPYLRLAVKVAQAQSYVVGGKSDTMDTRIAEVKAAWAEGMDSIPVSDPALKAIAKVIGFPDPEAIERGRKATERRKRGVAP